MEQVSNLMWLDSILLFKSISNNVIVIKMFSFYSAPELFDTFEKMRTDHKESLEFDKAWDVLKTVKNANGEVTKDNDLETLIKAAVGEEKKMDFGKFMNLFCRIKQSRSWFSHREIKNQRAYEKMT